MADYASFNTARYRIRYKAQGYVHSLTLRYAPSSGLTSVQETFDTFLSAMAPLLTSDFTILSSTAAATNSDVFLPVDPQPLAITPTSLPILGGGPSYYTFIGQSNLGSQVKFTLYGAGFQAAQNVGSRADYRLVPSENINIPIALAALDDVPLIGIDGTPANWYPYINLGYNAHWQKKSRIAV